MSLIVSRHHRTDELRYDWAAGPQRVFDVALARGDELIHIAPNKEEFPVTVEQVKLAKVNRDRFIDDGLRFEPLPELSD